MRKTKRARMAVDAAMTALLPCLMAYSLIGESFHEIAGVVITLKKKDGAWRMTEAVASTY